MAKPQYQPRTREQRKAWWNSLSPEEQASYTAKWENKRNVVDREVLNIPPLTDEEAGAINDTMRRLGLERFIVLPDADHYQEELADELRWIS